MPSVRVTDERKDLYREARFDKYFLFLWLCSWLHTCENLGIHEYLVSGLLSVIKFEGISLPYGNPKFTCKRTVTAPTCEAALKLKIFAAYSSSIKSFLLSLFCIYTCCRLFWGPKSCWRSCYFTTKEGCKYCFFKFIPTQGRDRQSIILQTNVISRDGPPKIESKLDENKGWANFRRTIQKRLKKHYF